MMSEALRQVSAFARHDCLVVLITDGFGLDDDTRRLVTRLTEHNDLIVTLVYDPLERDLGDSGRLVFSDGDGQLEIDTQVGGFRKSYVDEFEQTLDRVQDTSRRFTVPLLPVHTGAPVAEQVRDILGHVAAPSRY